MPLDAPLEPSLWALLPPLVALGLAIYTRQVLIALGTGGLVGTVLLALRAEATLVTGLGTGLLDFVRLGILGQVSVASNAQVMMLIALIGGFVYLLERSGAARALALAITRGVRTPKQAMFATWLSGLALFFSDFGSVLIVGPVFRPIYDKLHIPREKLAWIIDSTAAPVCVMLPFVTWGVYAMGLIEQGFDGQPPARVEAVLPGLWQADAGTVDGFGAFIRAAPYQLYPLLCLLSIPLILQLGGSWGAMRHARPAPPEATPTTGQTPSAITAIAPLLVLLVVVVAIGGWSWSTTGKLTGSGVRLALATAYLAATGTCVALLRQQGLGEGAWTWIREGLGRSAGLLVLLVLAWTLGDVCKQLGTGATIAAWIGDGLPPSLLPLALFGAGALTSFATGTSWGTFALLMPIALPLSVALGAPAAPCIGAVLSGGVLGDHTSPISDTTLMASMAAGTEHADHVATQLPYAAVAGMSAAVAFAFAGATASPWAIGVGMVALGLLTATLHVAYRGTPSSDL
jgi:Na+/H+ antiporter NhaC